MKVGSVRGSTVEQKEARQEVLMQILGVERIYLNKLSGKNTDRPQLKEMMAFVREGDTVIVESISRFSRNTKVFLTLVEELDRKKVAFVSQKENGFPFTRTSCSGRSGCGVPSGLVRNSSVRNFGFLTVRSNAGGKR